MTALRFFGGTGVRVPTLGQGTWQIDQGDRRSAIAALREGIELGLTHIDTAELYGAGVVEELVAQALTRTAHTRDRLFIVSKVAPSFARNAERMMRACEQSLTRLRTDYLDCYLLHWPGGHPIDDSVAAFEKLRSDGKIRSWGLSKCDLPRLERAYALVGPGKIACAQVIYHLAQRSVEQAIAPWCREHGVALVAGRPFGGPFGIGGTSFPPTGDAGRTLTRIAERLGATTRQVALAFLTREPHMFAIPKASKVEHVRENAGACAVSLTEADISALDAAFPIRAGSELMSTP